MTPSYLDDSKRQGSYYESLFRTACLKRGLAVSVPDGDHLPYDLVVEGERGLRRVQVKGTTYKEPKGGAYKLIVGHGPSKLGYDAGSFDFLGAYVDAPDVRCWYVIPPATFGAVRGLKFYPHVPASRGKYGRYKNAFHIL